MEPNADPRPFEPTARARRRWGDHTAVKLAVLALLVLLLLIPVARVTGLIRERMSRQHEVEAEIAGIWGALMAVPILAVIRVFFDFLMDRVVVVPQVLDPLPVALVKPAPDAATQTVKTLSTAGAAAATTRSSRT